MARLLDNLAKLLVTRWKRRDAEQRHSRAFLCRCGSHIFFGNTMCLTCGTPLGYLPLSLTLVPLDPGPQPETWRAEGSKSLYRHCGNALLPAQCNWMVAADEANPLCVACRLNRTIPNLDDEENGRYWGLIEAAKRRLVAELLALGLPVKSKVDEDEDRGLMFDFLRSPSEGPHVLTGHASGLITLNVEEANDAKREKIRLALHEPYRTLLGHFRHEVGHYYWDRLVWDTRWLEPCRALFGDERADYAAALKANYDAGPPADWGLRHISSYASVHPWEDWAETWAHYLHIVDGLGTALGFGLHAEDAETRVQPFTKADLYAPDDAEADRFLSLLNSWVELITVVNELARSMGQHDFYPFVMPGPVAAKLQFVHLVVQDAATAAPASSRRPLARLRR